MKVGDLVKAIPLAKWDVNPDDYTQIGVVAKLGIDSELLPDPDKIVLLNFGHDDGFFRICDWKFEVINENR